MIESIFYSYFALFLQNHFIFIKSRNLYIIDSLTLHIFRQIYWALAICYAAAHPGKNRNIGEDEHRKILNDMCGFYNAFYNGVYDDAADKNSNHHVKDRFHAAGIEGASKALQHGAKNDNTHQGDQEAQRSFQIV